MKLQTHFALRESPTIMKELSQYLYTPYALQKWPIKLIAVPEFSAGTTFYTPCTIFITLTHLYITRSHGELGCSKF